MQIPITMAVRSVLGKLAVAALISGLAMLSAAPVYTPQAGSQFYLLRDINLNAFSLSIPTAGLLDVTTPGVLAFFAQTANDAFPLANLSVTEAVDVNIGFATALDSPGQLRVLGQGVAATALTDPALVAAATWPLLFTFDLVQFNQDQGSAIYALGNFEAIQRGGEVPEPSTLALLAAGLGIVAVMRRRVGMLD